MAFCSHRAGLYMGVDGGGSHCRVRLTDEYGFVLGSGHSGAANVRLETVRVQDNINAAITDALAQAGLQRTALRHITAGFGMAGILTRADAARFASMWPEFSAARVSGDAHTACLGAFSGQDGAIMILGTGSAGYALVNGQGHSVGGWGFHICDDASAATLGRKAIHKSLHAHDGLVPRTPFTQAVLNYIGETPAAAVTWDETATPCDYGKIAPLVVEAAHADDAAALGIIVEAITSLTPYLDRLFDLAQTGICLMGGLSPHLAPWLDERHKAMMKPPQGDALSGTIRLAQGAPDGFGEPLYL